MFAIVTTRYYIIQGNSPRLNTMSSFHDVCPLTLLMLEKVELCC
jgi:hypothetical protein